MDPSADSALYDLLAEPEPVVAMSGETSLTDNTRTWPTTTSSTRALIDRALIVGSVDDDHVSAVLAALPPGVRPLLVDTSVLEEQRYVLESERLIIGPEGGAQDFALIPGGTGWIRRLSPPHWRRGLTSGSRDAAVRGAWTGLIVGIAGQPSIGWLTPYARLVSAENKLVQGQHAARLGIPTPQTVVARQLSDIPLHLGDPIAIKPLGVGNYTDDDGEARVVWAQSLHRHDPRLQHLAGAPFLAQEQMQARRHLRVVTVNDRAWACALNADGLPLDWRSDEMAHHAFSSIDDSSTEQAAVRLANALGLGYSSQDWIDTGHAAVFVDLNPAGQWMFLPDVVSQQVAQAIADHLAGTDTRVHG